MSDEPVAERPYMPDYGVESPQWQPLPWSWAAERLAAGRNYWAVTVSGAGRPHALPVWGVWHDGEQRFAFSCSPRARKAANLAANPAMVLTTEDIADCLSIEGRAERVAEPARQEVWAERYVAKYGPAEVSVGFILANLLVEFVPDRAFGMVESAFPTRATRWRWASG